MPHDFIGWIHTIAAIVALITGSMILSKTKGTAIHKKTGRVYGICMLTVCATAFMIDPPQRSHPHCRATLLTHDVTHSQHAGCRFVERHRRNTFAYPLSLSLSHPYYSACGTRDHATDMCAPMPRMPSMGSPDTRCRHHSPFSHPTHNIPHAGMPL